MGGISIVILVVVLLLSQCEQPVNGLRSIRSRVSARRASRTSRLHSEVVSAAVDADVAYAGPKLLRGMPKNDALDRRIASLALPAIVNFAILPLVGAVDTAFVGRMGNALALAGQGAANQVFSSTFWVISFLPSVITPLVAQAV